MASSCWTGSSLTIGFRGGGTTSKSDSDDSESVSWSDCCCDSVRSWDAGCVSGCGCDRVSDSGCERVSDSGIRRETRNWCADFVDSVRMAPAVIASTQCPACARRCHPPGEADLFAEVVRCGLGWNAGRTHVHAVCLRRSCQRDFWCVALGQNSLCTVRLRIAPPFRHPGDLLVKTPAPTKFTGTVFWHNSFRLG